MSRMRAILDRINDIEATIGQVESGQPSLATELSLISLEARRDELHKSLNEITRNEHVDVCNYVIIPEGSRAYAISAVTTVLHDFQDLVSIVYDFIASGSRQKKTAKMSAEVWQESQFDFGFSYSGSLGVAMTIPNERLLAVESTLDEAVTRVLTLLKSTGTGELREQIERVGIPALKKLHHLAKTHSTYEMSADITWKREDDVRARAVVQVKEMEEIVRIIESRGDKMPDPVTILADLVAWNVPRRTFTLYVAEGEFISGHWSESLDGETERRLPGRYLAQLTKNTTVRYTEDDLVTWVLDGLDDPPDFAE